MLFWAGPVDGATPVIDDVVLEDIAPRARDAAPFDLGARTLAESPGTRGRSGQAAAEPAAAPAVDPGEPGEVTDTPLGPPPVEGRRDLDLPPPTGSGSGGVDVHPVPPPVPDRPPVPDAGVPGGGAGPADQRVITPPGSSQPHQPVPGPLPGSGSKEK
jgi:hypothetical protein